MKRGLSDLSISRTTFDWGVPVPGDPKHVMYVWVDALTNYITATAFPTPNAPRAKFWPADAHVIGKDITRFHAVYWPAFLMSAGIAAAEAGRRPRFSLQPGGEDVEVGRQCDRPVRRSPRHYGVDQLRYFFLREVPFGQDGNYSHEAIVNRINADLANDLGNLAQRSLSMIAKNCEGRVPTPGELTRCGQGDSRAGRGALGEGARGDAGLRPAPDARRNLGASWRKRTAISPREEPWVKRKSDPARHGDDPLCHGGGAAHRRDPRAAVHAGVDGAVARFARGARKTRAIC